MSMCWIGFRAGNHTHVAYLHYSQGVLDWRKWHEQRASGLAEHALKFEEGSESRAYFERQAEESRRVLADPSYPINERDRDAQRLGFWTCETKEEQARWRKHARECDDSNHVRLDHCAVVYDFTRKHAVIRDRGFSAYEECLPDGWTFEFGEIGK